MLTKNSWNKNDLILIFAWTLLVVFSLVKNEESVLVWPASAVLPGVFNMIDVTLFSQDFYAISSRNTPVIFYQKIIFFINSITGLGPFKSLGIVGTLVVAFYIPTLFLLFIYALNGWISRTFKGVRKKIQINTFAIISIFIACLLLIQFTHFFNLFFTFMGWPPIFLIPAAYIISMMLGFSAFFFKTKYIHALLCMTSCLVHPSMGLLTIIFCSILFVDFKSRKAILNLFVWSFVPVILSYLFLILNFPQQKFDSIEFIEIFINYRHSHHYLLSENFPLKRYVVLVAFPLLVMYLILKRLRSAMKINCLLALSIITFIPLFHFIFTEVYLIKEVAILGLPRFFMLGLFFIPFFGVVVALELLNSSRSLQLIRYQFFVINHFFSEFREFLNRYFILVIVMIILMLSFSIVEFAAKEFSRIKNTEIKFNTTYKNILNKIESNDVVMVLDYDNFDFGLYGRVNSYANGAFPFSSSNFHEFIARENLFEACRKSFNKDTVSNAAKNFKLDFIVMNQNRLPSGTKEIILGQSEDLVLIDVKMYLQSFNY